MAGALLAVLKQNATQLLVAPGVYHIISGERGGGVHPHVQRCVMHIGKSTGRVIQLRRGYSKIK
jgi:hypothetical protein